MNIQTKFLGEVEINEQDIITFEKGILGLEEITQYILLPMDSSLPLAILQATEHAEVSFIVALPFAFKPDYVFDLNEEDIAYLQVNQPEDIMTYSIVTLAESLNDSTINLLAPIIINIDKKVGKQVVLDDSKVYPLKFALSELEGSVK